MSCFPCFGRKNEDDDDEDSHKNANVAAPKKAAKVTLEEITPAHIESTEFKFRDLAAASKNFRPDLLLGEGGLGRVYKGCLESNKQVVAIKQLDRHSVQSNKEFLMDVMKLSVLNHANLVNLVGFCADGEQRLLVYEYFPLGSLDHHLLDLEPDQRPMNWQTRMKIAHGIAQGLEYLHETANPPVIFGNLKSANVLLDDQYNARLSDFGLSRSGPKGEKTHLGMMEGTYGYCAPEYERTGQLTVKADVYSFGVVILELITGRRAIDTTKDVEQQNLVAWALPIAKDQKRLPELVDPLMNQDYPVKSLNQAVAIANMCLQEEPTVRPMIADISMALSFLSMDIPAMPGSSNPPPI